MRVVLSLEGNIGAGKSSLLRLLACAPGIRTVDEPLDTWRGGADGRPNLLNMFYADPTRWAFTFQTAAFLSRAEGAKSALRSALAKGSEASCRTWVLERSVQSDKQCFATNCRKTGLFTEAEWCVYNDYHTWLVNEHEDLRIDGAVYLRAQPSTCMARLRKRGRPEEASVPVDYLEQLHSRHEEWLIHEGCEVDPDSGSLEGACVASQRSVSSDGIPVLILDCDPDFASNDERKESMLASIRDFADSLPPRSS